MDSYRNDPGKESMTEFEQPKFTFLGVESKKS